MKKIILYLFIIIALGFTHKLFAESVIKATINQNTTCGTDVLAIALILEYADNSDMDFNIGNSTIFLNYNTDKLLLYGYVESDNFEDHCFDVSETANKQNGFINVSINDVTVNTTFSSSTNQHLVGYVFFNIAVGKTVSSGDIYIDEYFTSFNNKTSNNGTEELTAVFDNDLTLNNAEIACLPQLDIFDTNCNDNDSVLINNIVRNWTSVCTVDDASLSLVWPNHPYYNDLQISINGGQTFTSPNAGQNRFDAFDLAVGNYDIKVKKGANGCVTTLDDINIMDLSHEVTRTWGAASCGQNNGWLQLTWLKKALSKIDISIDGGQNYVTVPAADELFRVENLSSGDYDIRVKWSYAPFACPAQLDDINLHSSCKIASKQSTTIYPNPANQQITIKVNDKIFETCKVEIFNLTGMLIKYSYLKPNQTKAKLSIKNLANGVYMVKVIIDNKKVNNHKLNIVH